MSFPGGLIRGKPGGSGGTASTDTVGTWRELHPRARTRRRRDVARLRRDRSLTRPPRGREDPPPGDGRGRERRPLQTRDHARGAVAAPAHRPRPRRRRDRRTAVLHDADGGGAVPPQPARQGRPAANHRSDRHHAGRRQGARVRARARRRPPGHQARQRAPLRRLRGGHRFRCRQGLVRVEDARTGRHTHAGGQLARHPRLHGARAGRRGSRDRSARGYLRVRHHGVRDARWPAALSRPDAAEVARRANGRTPGADQRDSRRHAAAAGRPGDALPRKGPRRSAAVRV